MTYLLTRMKDQPVMDNNSDLPLSWVSNDHSMISDNSADIALEGNEDLNLLGQAQEIFNGMPHLNLLLAPHGFRAHHMALDQEHMDQPLLHEVFLNFPEEEVQQQNHNVEEGFDQEPAPRVAAPP